MECDNSCADALDTSNSETTDRLLDLYNQLPVSSLHHRKNRIRQHNSSEITNDFINDQTDKPLNDLRNVCIHDNKIYQFNTTWFPFSCTLCRCNYNSVVDCFIKDCPSLENCSVS